MTLGTNRLVTAATVDAEVQRLLAAPARTKCAIPLWDGRTASRVVESLKRRTGL